MDGELLVRREGKLGRIVLNRPEALNSLTLGMVRGVRRALDDFARDPDIVAVFVTGAGEKAFCAGGDIRQLYELKGGDREPYRMFWREEYALNAMIARYPKRYVALMDCVVMGGGMGVSAHGNRRVATERTRLAMPEAAIGFVPDVGGTYLLSRAGSVGDYMALSGETADAADAIDAGLADLFIASRNVAELGGRLSGVGTEAEVDLILADLQEAPPPGSLRAHRAELDRAMKQERLADILRLLDEGSEIGRAHV
jgi:enoyl-CoA hydratase